MWTSAGVGRVALGERDVIIYPTNHKQSMPGVVYVHGAEGDMGGGLTWMKIHERLPLLRALSDAGHVIISADLGGVATWGNDTALSRITAATSVLRAQNNVDDGPVVLVGQSMGGLNSILWAKSNTDDVLCIVLVIPVINLTDIHDNRGLDTVIDAAYLGGYSEDTYGSSKNPATLAANGELNGIEMLLYYGTTDTICVPSESIAFGNSVANAILVPLSGGHEEAIVPKIDEEFVVTFINGAAQAAANAAVLNVDAELAAAP